MAIEIPQEKENGKVFQVSCFMSLSSAHSTQYFHLYRAKWLMRSYRGGKSCVRPGQILK